MTFNARTQQSLGNAMNDQVRVAPDRRRKVRIGGRSQCKVPLVRFGVACLPQRAQHEVAQNALLGLALDSRRQLLVHLRSDGNVLSYFVHSRLASLAV